MNLEEMNGPQLTVTHNRLAKSFDDIKPIAKWGGKVSVLRDKVADLLKDKEHLDRVEKVYEGLDDALSAKLKNPIEYFYDETIRVTALKLLCHVVGTSEEGRTLGLSYYECLDVIYQLHKNCKTSAACLRWYAVKVRAPEHGYEEYRLVQQRPKSKGVRIR